MVLGKASNWYLGILYGDILHPIQSEQDDEQEMINSILEY